MNAVYYLIYRALAARTSDTLERMIQLEPIRKLVDRMRLREGKVG